ncbi:MAG: tetratricopeptide repeat protein [Pseudoxanthomonas sp.]
MYDNIIDALRRRATSEALAAARELVTAQPEDAQAHRWLAAALQENGEAEAALASIDHAISLSPEEAGLHLARAGVLLGSRQVEAAQSALEQATGLDPNQLGSYLMQAQLALGRGDLGEVERLHRLAVRVAPDHPRLAAIEGMLELQRGNGDAALRIVTRGLQQAPADEQLRYALGFVHMQKGHLAFAEQAFRSLLESNPAAASLRSLIADLVYRQGRPDEAVELVAPLLADPATATPGLQRFAGQMHLASGQAEQAMPLLYAALAALPNDRATLETLVGVWHQRGELEVARNALDAALSTTANAPNLWIARLALEVSGSPLELPLANRWVASMPGSLQALEAQMEAYAALGQAEQAEAIAQQVVALSPGHSAAEAYLFNTLLTRDPSAAAAHAQSLLAQSRSEQSRQLLLGWRGLAQDRAGQYAEAVSSWSERASSLAPNQLPPHRITSPYQEWPQAGAIPPETTARPLFLWGAPGSGVERVATVLGAAGAPLLADRFRADWPGDLLQHYDSIEALGSGAMDATAMVASWRANLPARGITDGNVVDWLVWWDNSFLKAFRPYLADGVLLVVLRDPRDMLLQWLAFGAPSQMALPSPNEGALWLSEMLGQVVALSEDELYPHFLLRLDGLENDAAALTEALGKTLRAPALPAPTSLGPAYLATGRWRDYAHALAEPFARLTPVAVRLGYPQD